MLYIRYIIVYAFNNSLLVRLRNTLIAYLVSIKVTGYTRTTLQCFLCTHNEFRVLKGLPQWSQWRSRLKWCTSKCCFMLPITRVSLPHSRHRTPPPGNRFSVWPAKNSSNGSAAGAGPRRIPKTQTRLGEFGCTHSGCFGMFANRFGMFV